MGETVQVSVIFGFTTTFSILERIDVGETPWWCARTATGTSFSILERIDVGETNPTFDPSWGAGMLSVSSNGSTWVKLTSASQALVTIESSFSILERIDVGETS